MARHRELGLTDDEYELIVEKLEREPNEVELAIFSLMWSEHCGYKHSRRLLRTLPTEGPKLILGPGSNRWRSWILTPLPRCWRTSSPIFSESTNRSAVPSALTKAKDKATGV